jgi:hypothetical protein
VSFKDLKINGNQLFTPSVLLLVLFFMYQVSLLQFKNPNESYSFLLAIALVIFAIKAFIIAFASIEKYRDMEKWVLFLFNIILFSLESWLVWKALVELTLDSYPKFTLGALLLANIGFYLQAYITKIPKMLWIGISSFVIYTIIFVLLLTSAFNAFVGNNLLLIVFQQTTAYLALGMELIMLFLTGRYFVKKN